uniref:TNFR-Cys domain-containing protein n=1 Tax=Myotis lucifugus TaxID=59463 RepID=G1P776_MYOLU
HEVPVEVGAPPPKRPLKGRAVAALTRWLQGLGCPALRTGMPLCKEEEFPTGAMCCPKCRPGSRVQEACGELRTTVCAPCTLGTYTAHLNALRECLPCCVCDPGLGQVTRWNCTTRTNTVCGCGQGHFCERQDGDSCIQCRPHSVCRPGQRVRETGTEWQDTLCEDCQPGTFSVGGTQAACTPWTRCSGTFDWEATPGPTAQTWGPVIISVTLVIAVISVPLVLLSIRKRTSRGEQEPLVPSGGTGEPAERNRRRDLQASRVQPDVTTEPVEETASVFPQSD